MFRTLCVRGLILIFLLVLGAPLASAAGSREPEGLSVRSVVSALWNALVGLIPGEDGTDPADGGSDPNSGPHMDPNGNPTGP